MSTFYIPSSAPYINIQCTFCSSFWSLNNNTIDIYIYILRTHQCIFRRRGVDVEKSSPPSPPFHSPTHRHVYKAFTCNFLPRYSSRESLFMGENNISEAAVSAFYKLKHQPSTCTHTCPLFS